jgi:hypothetical protein
MWMAAVPVRWEHVVERRKDYRGGERRTIDVTRATFVYEQGKLDSAHTDEKVRQLLSLSGILTPIAVVLVNSGRPGFAGWVVVGLLLMSVFLCLQNLEVRNEVRVTDESVSDDDWSWSLHDAAQWNAASHSFRVDAYRSARRYFLMALIMTPVAAGVSSRRADYRAPIAEAHTGSPITVVVPAILATPPSPAELDAPQWAAAGLILRPTG